MRVATLPHNLRARLLGLPPLAPDGRSAAAGWLAVGALYALSAGYVVACFVAPESSIDPAHAELVPLGAVAVGLVAVALGRVFLSRVGFRSEAPVSPLLATAVFAPFGVGQGAAIVGALLVLQNARQRGLLPLLGALLFWNLGVWPWLLYANTVAYYRFVAHEGVTVLVDPALSTFAVLGAVILGVITALSLLRGWWRSRSRANHARTLVKGQRTLAPGDAIVTGTVALAPGESHAVRLDIEQAGEEYDDSGEWVRWTEVERRLSVRPFYLHIVDSGAWVRVEPSSHVRLMDDLHGAVLVDRRHRMRSAELTVGERVTAVGRLHWGRDPHGNPTWVLHEPPGAPLLLASVPLDAPFARQAAALGWTLGVCLFLHTLLLGWLGAFYFGGPAVGFWALLARALPWVLMAVPALLAIAAPFGHAIGTAPSWYEEPTVDDREQGRLPPGPEPAATKKKGRLPTPSTGRLGSALLLLGVVPAACSAPLILGVHFLVNQLGTATIVGLDPSGAFAHPHELRVRSDFPIHARLPPSIGQRAALVEQRCRAAGERKPLKVVLVFDAGGDLFDVIVYLASEPMSRDEQCVREAVADLHIAWSPVRRYRLYLVDITL